MIGQGWQEHLPPHWYFRFLIHLCQQHWRSHTGSDEAEQPEYQAIFSLCMWTQANAWNNTTTFLSLIFGIPFSYPSKVIFEWLLIQKLVNLNNWVSLYRWFKMKWLTGTPDIFNKAVIWLKINKWVFIQVIFICTSRFKNIRYNSAWKSFDLFLVNDFSLLIHIMLYGFSLLIHIVLYVSC